MRNNEMRVLMFVPTFIIGRTEMKTRLQQPNLSFDWKHKKSLYSKRLCILKSIVRRIFVFWIILHVEIHLNADLW